MVDRILISRGTPPVKLATGKSVKIPATKDQAYQVIDLSAPPGNAPADPAKLAKEGSDLVVSYPDGTQFTLGDFFTVCAGNACTVTLADGTATGQIITAGAVASGDASGLGLWGWLAIIGGGLGLAAAAGGGGGSSSTPAVDTTAPNLVGSAPSDNATAVPVASNLVLTFSEAVKAGSGNFVLSNGTDTHIIAVTDTAKVTFSGITVTINPATSLQANSNYNLQFASGVVLDQAGNEFSGISGASALNFSTPDTVAPVLSSSSPADGASAVLAGSSIVLTFSEAVQAGGGNIVISNGTDTRTISVTDTSQVAFSGNTVTINPATDLQENSNYNVQLASGVIRDVAGNAYAGINNATALNFQTSDVTDPVLITRSPADNATAVAVGANIVMTFSEAVQAGSGSIVISNGTDTRSISIADATQVTISGNTVTINPLAPLQHSSDYNVQMASGVILDLVGRNFAGIFGGTNFNFTTQDLTAPVLVSSSPADNASAVLLGSNIVLTFNEAVQAGSGSIVISNGSDTRTISITDASQVSFNANIVTINPATNLQPNSTYSVQMASGVLRDLAGNNHAGITSATTLNFATEDTQGPTLSSSMPADNGSGVAMSSNIVLTFSELVQAGSGNIVISNGSDTRTISVTDTSQVAFSGSSVTINPIADLQANSSYNVQISVGAVRDLVGNDFAGIANATTLNFNTQDQVAPTLSSTSPVDNAAGVLVGGNLVLTFNEAVQAGSGSIVISNGTDTRVIDVADTSQVTFSGNTATINPSVNLQGNSTYNVQLANGVIRDLSGNNFAGLFGSAAFNFDTQDLSTPTLTSSTPADNATAVTVGSNIVLTFSEAVQAGTGNIVVSNGTDTRTISVTDTTQVTFSGSTVTINPTANLQGGSAYNVQMASGVIRDLAGNNYAGITNATDLNFATQDLAAPTLVSSSPADDTMAVPVASNIVLTFSETVQAGSGNIVISNGAGDARTISVTDTSQVTFSGNTVTINPTADLQVGSYNVRMVAGVIRDASGNNFAGITNATTLNFSTELKVELSAVAAGVGGFVINGQEATSYSCIVYGAGDVNGDGLMDVIVGAPEADTAAGADAGRSYVVFGKTGTTAVDLSAVAAGNGGFVIDGHQATSFSGTSVSGVGDLNGDGLADLLIGAEDGSPDAGRAGAGRSYVVYGKTSGTAVNLSGVATGNGGFVIDGAVAGDFSGESVRGLGDVNGDGFSDLVIGADNAGSFAGRAYVLYGGSALTSLNLSAVEAGGGGFVINGAPGDSAGSLVSSAGDVNGDGLADVLVGAFKSTEQGFSGGGRAYVVFGKTGNEAVDLSAVVAGTGGLLINGLRDSHYLGMSVQGAGDVNGDGLADVIVGTGEADPDEGGAAKIAQSFVVFGRAGAGEIELTNIAAGIGGFVINGQCMGDGSGMDVAGVGDLNGDGLADLLVGAPMGDTGGGMDAGRSYVVYGKTGTAAVNLSAIAAGSGGFVINGQAASDYSGVIVSGAGDVNGDGLADLLIGAMGADPGPGPFTGRSYVLFGSTSGAFAQTAVDQYGTTGADSFTDGGTAQTLITGAGNDTLTATAASVLYGGAGNDTFNVSGTMIAALRSAFGVGGNTTQLARVDGGTGIDTLSLSGAGLTLNLTLIANQAGGNPDGGSRIDSIERINLTGSGNNALILSAADVRDMAGLNLYNNGNGWSGLGASVQRHQLVVDGNAGDSVTVSGTWSQAANVSNGGQNYRVYNNEESAAQLLVDSDITLSIVVPVQLSAVAAGVGGFVINGQGLGEWSGFAASAGDVNGDGLIDVIVGAPEFDPVAGADAGRSYVVFGKTGTTAVDLSAIAAGVGGFAINGQGVGDMSGQSVANAGDINGDGLADLIMGGEGNNSTNEAGRTWVVYGKTSGTAVNLSAVAAGAGGFRIAGDNAGDSSGVSVSGGGDINGDGYADLIIGADHADFLAGRAYVFFGGSTLASVNLSAMEAGVGGFAIRGMPTDQVGISVDSAGDVNGDGLTDVIVAADSSDESGAVNSGRAYVVFGRTGSTAVELSDVAAGTGGFMIDGNQASQFLGYNVSGAGDVNGDGLADLLVGSGKADPDAGGAAAVAQTYVVFGRTSGAAVQLSALQAGVGGFVINGQSAGDGSGTAVAGVGDLNGDGLADMLVGAAWGDTSSGMDAGRSYVVYGKSGTTAVNLSAVALGSGGFAINGQSAGDFSGGIVAGAGDVNGDGLDDLLVSAVGAMGDGVIPGDFVSRVYVLFGSTSGAFSQSAVDQYGTAGADTFTDGGIAQTLVTGAGNDTLTATAASVLYGGTGNDVFNINTTMIAALQSAMGTGGNITQLARIDGGTGIDTLSLSGAGLTLNLAQVANQSAGNPDGGSRIDSIERINLTGTGNNTLTLSAADIRDIAGLNLYNNGNGWSGLGASVQRHQLVVDGNAGDSVTVQGVWSQAADVSNGGQTYRVYNNMDSAAQLMVDSDLSTNISLGVALSAIAAGIGGFAINGLSANEGSSWSTSGAGDVNGDGLVDLIVGAPTSDPVAGAEAGRSYVVFGKTGNAAIDLSAVAAGTGGFVINGQNASDFSGTSVANAGDINGDGLADLLVGAEAASPGGTPNAGKTYVVFGKTSSTAVNLSAVDAGVGGFVINGASAQDWVGRQAVSVGDVNADGFADLLIGTLGDGPQDTGPESVDPRAYLVFGKSSGTAVDLSAVASGLGGFVINGPTGQMDGDGLWVSSVGDFNGDGLADMGLTWDRNNVSGDSWGINWIAYGKSDTAAIDLSNVEAGVGGFSIGGDLVGNKAERLAAAGDVNGDGFADVMFISRASEAGTQEVGRISVVFGSAGAVSIDVTDVGQSAAGFVINGQDAGDYLGTSMSAGDLNGDGLADLLISAPAGSTVFGERVGKSYVVFGKTDNAAINLSAVRSGSGGFIIHGEATDDYSGIEVDVAGDINGDGLADLVVSGGGVDTSLVDAGRTYVIFGSTSGAFAQTKVDQYGTAGADSFSDGGTAQTLVTGDGNDTLTATAASVLYGGAGNDVFNISTTMITALRSAFGAGGNVTQLARIDGGTGTDTLALSGSGLTLNLTQIANQAASNPDGGSRIDSIERVDLTGTGNNTLVLQLRDVLDMGSANTFAATGRQQLLVTGNAGDSVDLADAAGTASWTQSGTASISAVTYNVWNHNTSLATVYVGQSLTVI